jgi:hypothetical protein
MEAIVVGVVLGVIAIAFVLQPLASGSKAVAAPLPAPAPVARKKGATLEDPAEALQEIEADRAAGKLSDEDYALLTARYRRAAATPKAVGPSDTAATAETDAAEVAVKKLREKRAICPKHGARPEADPYYCSVCGTYLRGACRGCGRAVSEHGARYCSTCGVDLAA